MGCLIARRRVRPSRKTSGKGVALFARVKTTAFRGAARCPLIDTDDDISDRPAHPCHIAVLGQGAA